MVTVNGNEYEMEQVREAATLINNETPMSVSMDEIDTQNRLSPTSAHHQHGRNRDMYEVLGYDKKLDIDDYRGKYDRGDIATRIIELAPHDSWSKHPIITDSPDSPDKTDFQKKFEKLAESVNLFNNFMGVDIGQRIGEFSALFIGVSERGDDDTIKKPLGQDDFNNVSDIGYVSPFTQEQVKWKLGKDMGMEPTDARYNYPVYYSLNFADLDSDDDEDDDWRTVHWSRVIHIANGRLGSELKGRPELQSVYNRLDDLEKVLGSSAEMFFTGADRKFHLNVEEGKGDIPDEMLKRQDKEMQRLVHDLTSHIKTTGSELNVIGGEDPDPSGIIEQEIKFLSAGTGVPQNKLIGNEMGERATTQDRKNWFDSIRSRQNNFCGPDIIRPFIDRLIIVGVLPKPNEGTYTIQWQDLFTLNRKERAELELKRSKVVAKLAPQGNIDLFPGGVKGAIKYIKTGNFPDIDENGEVKEPLPDEDDEEALDQVFVMQDELDTGSTDSEVSFAT